MSHQTTDQSSYSCEAVSELIPHSPKRRDWAGWDYGPREDNKRRPENADDSGSGRCVSAGEEQPPWERDSSGRHDCSPARRWRWRCLPQKQKRIEPDRPQQWHWQWQWRTTLRWEGRPASDKRSAAEHCSCSRRAPVVPCSRAVSPAAGSDAPPCRASDGRHESRPAAGENTQPRGSRPECVHRTHRRDRRHGWRCGVGPCFRRLARAAIQLLLRWW
mmetsp:Transcript_41199/g.103874  ORF Transcript_41199/g.103874 Transcript_41199/m.103874 type:complete len:217 (-) Transcript_41199:720-1370(-)